MTTGIGPTIRNSNLVFSYNVRSRESWLGKPTTNYYANPDTTWNGSNFALGYNSDFTTAPTQSYTWVPGVPNPAGANAVLRYYSGATQGYKYFSLDSASVPTTQNYMFSYYARIFAGPTGSSNLNNGQLWRNNLVGDQGVVGDWNPTFTTQWQKFAVYGSVTASNILQLFPIHGGSILPGYTIDYCGFQLEPGTVASPWSYGSSRTTTNSLLDQTGRNTLTIQSGVQYDTDGTPKFDGTVNSYISTNSLTVPNRNAPYTVAFWIKRTRTNVLETFISSWTNATISNAFYLGFNGGAGANIMRFGDGWGDAVVPGVGVTNTWINIIAVNEVNDAKIYVNGSLAVSRGAPLSYTGTSSLLTIGRQGEFTGGEFFSGEIDQVDIYNASFTATDAQKYFNATRGPYGV